MNDAQLETLIALRWPEAVAVIAAIIAITTGAIKIYGMHKSKVNVDQLHQDQVELKKRVGELEKQMSMMETNIENTISGQIADLKGDMRRMSDKMDTLVREVVTALGSLSNHK